MRTGEAECRGRDETVVIRAEVDGDVLDDAQLGNVLDRGRERVGEGELRRRLTDDGEQRTCPLKLELQRTVSLARMQRVRSTHSERRELPKLLCVERFLRSEEELQ